MKTAALLVLLAVSAVGPTGCASNAVAARPTPFPGALGAALLTTEARGVIGRVLALRGTPYRLGGDRPATGFDCSGLVRYVFREVRIELPRTVAEQFLVGTATTTNDVEPGDLVFFHTTPAAAPSHVGIALGRSTFVHAPGSGSVVRVERFDTPYWTARFGGVRRVVGTP